MSARRVGCRQGGIARFPRRGASGSARWLWVMVRHVGAGSHACPWEDRAWCVRRGDGMPRPSGCAPFTVVLAFAALSDDRATGQACQTPTFEPASAQGRPWAAAVTFITRRVVLERPLHVPPRPTPTGHVQRAPTFETTPPRPPGADTEVRPCNGPARTRVVAGLQGGVPSFPWQGRGMPDPYIRTGPRPRATMGCCRDLHRSSGN